jgi:fermentation-respiration switch protein FrsA (DUF1100 family)
LDLALDHRPAGLVLVSTFTGIRELGRVHYPFVPAGLIPDAYPTLRRIHALRTPLLLLHGERDEIVPLSHGRALVDAAPMPREIHVFPGLGHNDVVTRGGAEFAEAIASWARGLQRPLPAG